ncbi:hypothetical protein V5O48_011836 [Marasmius crinis-equi]|uniref:F-box domain-containing protein n=1 Tax=Marasmius crinis-equi TaxID=585013 RepID=A0ABR3F4V3_9AGAR
MSILPREIMNAIVDACSDDPSTLISISLVGSAWLPSTRIRLFETLRLNLFSIDNFLDVACNPHSTFNNSVKGIEIDGSATTTMNCEPFLTDLSSIRQLATALPSLVSLRLHNFHLEHASEPAVRPFIDAIKSSFSEIRELELDGIVFISVSQPMTMLCSFRMLEKITMRDLVWQDPTQIREDGEHSYELPSSLVYLSLHSCCKRDIITCLLSQNPPPVIHHLDVGLISPEDCPSFGEYIGGLGAHLFSLSLEFRSFDAGGDAEDFHKACNLSTNTGLRSILFESMTCLEYRLTSPVLWIAKILSQISSSWFEEVTFCMHVFDVDEMNGRSLDDDWHALDAVLNEMHRLLPAFESATFLAQVWGETSSAASLAAFLETVLPLSCSEKIVRVKRR